MKEKKVLNMLLKLNVLLLAALDALSERSFLFHEIMYGERHNTNNKSLI